MTKIGISGFKPGDNVVFKIRMDLYGDRISPIKEYFVPKFPPLITFANVQLLATPAVRENYTNIQYGIERYKSEASLVAVNKNKVFLRLSTVNNLQKNDLINISASVVSSPLHELNGKNYRIAEIDRRNQRIAIDVLKQDLHTGSGSVNSSSNLVREIQGAKLTTGKTYTLSIGTKFFRSLLYTPYAQDILIFAFVQSKAKITPSDQKQLMLNGATVNESTPPSYSSVASSYGKKQSYARFLSEENGSEVEFYMAVARYTQRDGVWTGEWLQKNENKNAIWAKAPKAV